MCFIYHHISYHTSSYIIICLHALAEKNLSSSWAVWNWSYFSARWNSVFLIFSRMDRRYLKRICLPLSTNATIQYPLFFFSFWSLKVPVDLSKAACSLIHLGYLHCTELHVFLLIHLCFFPPYLKFLLIVISSSPSLARGENLLLFFSSAGILKDNIQFLLW